MPTLVTTPVHPRPQGWSAPFVRAFRFWAKDHLEVMEYQRGRR